MKKTPPFSNKKPHSVDLKTPKPIFALSENDQRKELKYHGDAACQMIWRQRPDDIIRIYVLESRVNELRTILKWVAAQRKAYHIVGDEDLQRLTESSHHQGICIVAKEHVLGTLSEVKSWLTARKEPQLLVYLDGVENPHNLGAIVRSCAHFAIPFILGDSASFPKLSASACRVAEGGAEFVKLVPLKSALQQLKELQAMGCELLATKMNGDSVYRHSFQSDTILIMGAEVSGVSKPILAAANKSVTIPGSGKVESLNVSVAFSVMASEFFRQGNYF